jgi:Fic family protein
VIFSPPSLDEAEAQVVSLINDIRGRLTYATSVPTRWFGLLARNVRARALRGSNSIEGYNVSVEDAIAALENELPVDAEQRDWAAVRGYRNAMTYVIQLADDVHFEYSEGFIRSLHYMMLDYDLSKHPGKWRPGPIYVRDEARAQIVYEAPPAEDVPRLMRELLSTLQKPRADLPVLVRAAMAHLNLVMIHPFSDGNGRMARCLQTLVLAREGILERHFCSIEEYLGANTSDYYATLIEVGRGAWHPGNDTRQWIRFNLTAHYRQAMTLLRRTREIQRIWDQLEVEVQQRGLPDRAIFALADAAIGLSVRNSTYRAAADISENLASRDLKMLCDHGLLRPEGEKRGRVYTAGLPVVAIRRRAEEPRGDVPDPFDVVKQTTIPGFEAFTDT